jgi:hypothetical protein
LPFSAVIRLFSVGDQQVKPFAQIDAAVFGQVSSSGRGDHFKALAACDPLPVDQGVGLEQRGVVQQGEGEGEGEVVMVMKLR